MKVLGIVGSPRKGGNTEILVNEVLKSAKDEGAETEILSVSDFNIEPCDGCYTCFDSDHLKEIGIVAKTRDPRSCWIDDDVEKIYRAISNADGLVIGSPVYLCSVSAQIKALMDRLDMMSCSNRRKDFENKVAAPVVVAETMGLLHAYTTILVFLFGQKMFIATTPFTYGIAHDKGDIINHKSEIRNARQLGKSIVELIKLTEPLRKSTKD